MMILTIPEHCTQLELGKQTAFFLTVIFFVAALLVWWRPLLRKGQAHEPLAKRYVSFAILAPLGLIPCYFGGLPFAVFTWLVTFFILREFFRMVRLDSLFVLAAQVLGFVIMIAALATSYGQSLFFYLMPVPVILTIITLPLILGRTKNMLVTESVTIFGITYFAWFLAHMILLRGLNGGFGYIVFLFVLVVFNDIAAYAIGGKIGKTHFIPSISPNKTIEGVIAGMLGTVLAALAFRFAVPQLNDFHFWMVTALIALLSPIGDLVVSVIKRDVGIKDSGRLLPGHGGMLDRLDSMVISAPIFYYYLLTTGFGNYG